ncbi:hypothetical protein Tco_0727938 [Tanacetum coccineum]|uniref:Reverse transcriptase Ty1/copia-type domain-containing protein n=1 Tax=Tanacetum coccineum TaxID=301880 RepID=A0ABQ4YMC7_9ASTR
MTLRKEQVNTDSYDVFTGSLKLIVVGPHTIEEDGIFICQDKYVAEILKKFNYSDVKSALTPVDLGKPLVKDGDADDVDVHLYQIYDRVLMYITASRQDHHVCSNVHVL